MKPINHALLCVLLLLTGMPQAFTAAGTDQTAAAATIPLPPQVVGISQMGAQVTIYLRPGGADTVASLACGENAAVQGWRFTEVRRASGSAEAVAIRLESSNHSVWLPVARLAAGGSRVPAAVPAQSQPLPGLDIPASQRGALHDQLLHRSRLRQKPLPGRARHAVSDLDPFPTRLALQKPPPQQPR